MKTFQQRKWFKKTWLTKWARKGVLSQKRLPMIPNRIQNCGKIKQNNLKKLKGNSLPRARKTWLATKSNPFISSPIQNEEIKEFNTSWKVFSPEILYDSFHANILKHQVNIFWNTKKNLFQGSSSYVTRRGPHDPKQKPTKKPRFKFAFQKSWE